MGLYFYLLPILFRIVTKLRKYHNIYINKLHIINNYFKKYIIKSVFL